ncbi:NAC domain-containing protein 104 [Rhodamnia argentea]|uniref:NAC domain-containing protein 104 n=1 Tax=Rhodamnia argentea TaxID=178133 RepID=A0A8B8PX19_9MYRT|nr:NAC domain-containing protein 104 [Rhodamnia argentea]
MGDNVANLPPGFRFYPTDEELVVHFLQRKAALLPCHPDVIPDLELYPYDPWELEGKALSEGNKWYFFSRRTPDRITGNGYWKAMGDDPVFGSSSKKVGMKQSLVYYLGETPGGMRTNWIMHEYRLSNGTNSGSSSSRSSKRKGHPMIDYSKWVVCRVYERGDDNNDDDGAELSCLDEVFLSLDDLDEISTPN